MRRVTGVVLVAVAAGGAATGLAVAGGSDDAARLPLRATPCAGAAHGALQLAGTLAEPARQASLLAGDGSSVQAAVRGVAVTFLVPMHLPAGQQPRELRYVGLSGAEHRVAVDVSAAAARTCPPPRPVSAGVPVRGPGSVQLALRPVGAGGPRLRARVVRDGPRVCVRVGSVRPGPYCMPTALLGRQDGLQGWAYRRPLADTTVLAGVADPTLIAAIRVRAHGWPSHTGVTLKLSRSGAFALAEGSAFRDGVTFELRPVYRRRHRPVLRLVGLGPDLNGPDGAPASQVNAGLLAHYAVLRRPARAGDALPAGRTTLLGDVNPAFARRLVSAPGRTLWLVPGQRAVCIVGTGGASCTAATARGLLDGHAPMAFASWNARSRRTVVGLVLPDGSGDVRLERDGRLLRRLALTDNGVTAHAVGAVRVSWRAPDGTRQGLPIGGP